MSFPLAESSNLHSLCHFFFVFILHVQDVFSKLLVFLIVYDAVNKLLHSR
jgi:hypothetical protein